MVNGVECTSPVIMTYLPYLSAMVFLCLNGMPLQIIIAVPLDLEK